ncbi:alpha/beta hydrolase [Agromyces sp. GXQ0307]|uniref:alpha/beta hydrolase n=1 Tax=Agromyces sp. GXQ0307 TaxID=3377835 RepID=UPI003839F81C
MNRAAASATAPGSVTAWDDVLPGRHGPIPVRRYQPQAAIAGPGRAAGLVIWLHGGAFSHGGLDQLESHAVGLALAAAGHPVVAVDYRRVPPWSWWRRPRPGVLEGIRYPVPLEDVIDAVATLRREADDAGRELVLGGASAGACLAAAAALRLGAERGPRPDGLLLVYGTFHAALPPISRALRARIRGPHSLMQFRPSTVERMNRNYAGSPEAMEDPWAFPGGHDLSGMPPTLVLDADRDSLRASGDAFVAELAKAGVDVTNGIVPESVHGFLDRPGTPAFERGIGRAIRWLDRH